MAGSRNGALCLKGIDNVPSKWRSAVLIPDGLTIDNKFIKIYKPRDFYVRVAANSLIRWISEMQIPIIKKSVLIIDMFGGYSYCVELLVKYFGTIYVYTENIPKYSQFCDYLYNLYGASVLLTDDSKVSVNCVLDIDGVARDGKQHEFVFRVDDDDLARLKIPDSIVEACPPMIRKELFAAALWEHCGLAEAGKIVAACY